MPLPLPQQSGKNIFTPIHFFRSTFLLSRCRKGRDRSVQCFYAHYEQASSGRLHLFLRGFHALRGVLWLFGNFNSHRSNARHYLEYLRLSLGTYRMLRAYIPPKDPVGHMPQMNTLAHNIHGVNVIDPFLIDHPQDYNTFNIAEGICAIRSSRASS